MRRAARWYPFVVWLVVLFILWESISWMLLHVWKVPLAQAKLPYPHKVLQTLISYSPTLLKQGWSTLSNATVGFVIGSLLGAILAIAMSTNKFVEKLVLPYAIASQMVPVLGLAPIIYGIFRDEQLSRTLIAAYITFFPVALNTLRGLTSTSVESTELMRVYAANPLQVYIKLRIPAALPLFLNGLKIAAPLSVTGAILVELMGAQQGIGVIMLSNLYYGSSHTYMLWSTMLTAASMGILSFLLIRLLERIATPWQPEFITKNGGE
jgi:NitT/TauT family transport system permease protein